MTVFHLKYRPQKIADLDLEGVVKTLKNILKSTDRPQSFLFAGPKGSGKTSTARILARAVNCLQPEGSEPCGECENCREILKGSSMDVMEIDAASNRGIEEAKELKNKAYLLPTKLKTKVFIVDEVHMMTREAFNALLKLIEEPPKHTLFILCTTDEDKIPETVLSRLLRISFYKGGEAELQKSLRRVVAGEGLKLEEGVEEEIIKRSDGSFRNLQKMINELVIEVGKKVTKAGVEEFFIKKFGDYNLEELENDLAGGKAEVIVKKLELMAGKGVNFRKIREQWLLNFQKKLLSALGVEEDGSKLTLAQLEKWLQLLIVAGKSEKDSPVEQLPLQLAVVEFLKPAGKNPEAVEIKTVEKAEKADPIIKLESKKNRGVKPVMEIDRVTAEWGRVLATVKPYNHSVEAFLRSSRPVAVRGSELLVEVFYPFHRDKLQEAKNKKIVEAGLSEVYGVEMEFVCVLGESKQEPIVIENNTPATVTGVEIATGAGEGDIYEVAKEIFG